MHVLRDQYSPVIDPDLWQTTSLHVCHAGVFPDVQRDAFQVERHFTLLYCRLLRIGPMLHDLECLKFTS